MALDDLENTLKILKHEKELHKNHVSREQLRIWNKRIKYLSHQIKILKHDINRK